MEARTRYLHDFLHKTGNTIYRSVRYACMVFLLGVLMFGCTPYINNIRSANELNNKKLLAGRIVLFDNDTPSKTGKLQVWINRQGDTKAKTIRPDENGYVYIPVEVGQYNMASYTVRDVVFGTFFFKFEKFPTVQVKSDDNTVNFGTLEIRFYQGTGSKIANLLVGGGRGYIRVSHVHEYDGVREVLTTGFGMAAGSVRNEVPVFADRLK